jgi:hypothetical protein
MRIEQGTRRVRHEVADGVRVMAFSLAASIAIAVGLGLL